MFAVPCSWHPPLDCADAAGAAARSTTTPASPLSSDLLDTSTSRDFGTGTCPPGPAPPVCSLADSENRRIGTLAIRSGRRTSRGVEPAHPEQNPTMIRAGRDQEDFDAQGTARKSDARG